LSESHPASARPGVAGRGRGTLIVGFSLHRRAFMKKATGKKRKKEWKGGNGKRKGQGQRWVRSLSGWITGGVKRRGPEAWEVRGASKIDNSTCSGKSGSGGGGGKRTSGMWGGEKVTYYFRTLNHLGNHGAA